MDNLKRDIRFLKQQNSQLQRELDDLKKKFSELEVANRQERADYATKVEELTRKMDTIQNNIQDTNYRITSMDQDGRPSTRSGAQNDIPSGTDTSASQPETTSQPYATDQSRELYNTAYRDLIRGNYQLALQGFQQFVTQYKNSDLIDNAQYWIGEVYYAQGRYQNAIEEFEKVVKWYRNGDKTASALLKIGYSYINIDEGEQGKIYLEEIIRDFPDSDEANLARGRLASLE